MAQPFGWGILASSSLVLGRLLVMSVRISSRTLGLVMAFGSGVLISAAGVAVQHRTDDFRRGAGSNR